ncbi:hypothetical protein GALMADRAFT_1174342 [Galerina marginata CBS 339.88]|uniref:Uncharacterized protein n=1 Tax=Galerina marginata (strain CBS 339.88) TaxID=685588 RepID=A0A067TA66_GALM3|nr:hypothetical protein GALMADRAFT_1174342 [Galerina marginata CBS 339.88]
MSLLKSHTPQTNSRHVVSPPHPFAGCGPAFHWISFGMWGTEPQGQTLVRETHAPLYPATLTFEHPSTPRTTMTRGSTDAAVFLKHDVVMPMRKSSGISNSTGAAAARTRHGQDNEEEQHLNTALGIPRGAATAAPMLLSLGHQHGATWSTQAIRGGDDLFVVSSTTLERTC